MSTPGRSRATAASLTVMLLSVSAGINFGAGGFGFLLCFMGVLVGGSHVAIGMADGGPVPMAPVAFASARALVAFVPRDATAVGLVMASCAVTMVSGEADPVHCFATFALLLLGVFLIIIGIDWFLKP